MSDLAVETSKVQSILGVKHLPRSIQRGICRTISKTNKVRIDADIDTPLLNEHFDALIHLSMSLKLKDLGPICGLLISSSTVHEWLQTLCEYSELLGFNRSFIQIEEAGKYTVCKLNLDDKSSGEVSRYTIFEMGLFFRLCNYSLGDRMESMTVSFPSLIEHCQIESLSAGFALTKNHVQNHDVKLMIPNETLALALPDSNQKVAKIFRKNIERTNSPETTDTSMTNSALKAIHASSSFAHASQKDIAKQLCVSERTLVRRLHADGVTFRELFNEVRNVKALELLFEGESIEAISTYLGFSERATFERAFKKWQKLTPVAMQSRFARLNNESAINNQITAEQIPNLPGVASRLLKLLNDNQSHMDALVQLVEEDPVLVAKILNIANSGAYGYLKANSVKSAVLTILGTEKLQSIALSILSTSAFNLDATFFNYRSYWLRSLSIANLCETINKSKEKSAQEDAESLYLTGLLHNIGELVIAFCLPKGFRQIQEESDGNLSFEQLLGLQSLRLGINTLEASAFLTKVWKLPETTVFALEQLSSTKNWHKEPQIETLSTAIKLHSQFEKIEKKLLSNPKKYQLLPILEDGAKKFSIQQDTLEKWFEAYLQIKKQVNQMYKSNVH